MMREFLEEYGGVIYLLFIFVAVLSCLSVIFIHIGR